MTKIKKIIKCFWPMLLGIVVCIGFQIIVNPSKLPLNQSVISDMIAQMVTEEKRQMDYMWYILKLRCSQIVFLLVFKFLKKEKIGNFLWLWIIGMGIGIGAYYFVRTYHILGLLLFAGFLFPHIFLYLFAYYKYIKIDYIGQYRDAKASQRRGNIAQKIKIFLVVIIGIMSEFYVNPYLVNFLGKIIYIKNYKI